MFVVVWCTENLGIEPQLVDIANFSKVKDFESTCCAEQRNYYVSRVDEGETYSFLVCVIESYMSSLSRNLSAIVSDNSVDLFVDDVKMYVQSIQNGWPVSDMKLRDTGIQTLKDPDLSLMLSLMIDLSITKMFPIRSSHISPAKIDCRFMKVILFICRIALHRCVKVYLVSFMQDIKVSLSQKRTRCSKCLVAPD